MEDYGINFTIMARVSINYLSARAENFHKITVDNGAAQCYNIYIKKGSGNMKTRRIVEMLVIVFMIMVTMWFITSYLDVICNNLTEHPQYQDWNIFKIMTDRHL